jgi:preprotein translocase subunit YajC
MLMLSSAIMLIQDAAAPQGGGLLGFLPFVLIFLVLYFLMIRPQAKRQKEQQKMISELKQGDEVVTIGGIHGTIAGVREQDNTLIVKIADNTKVIIDRSSVGRTVGAAKS